MSHTLRIDLSSPIPHYEQIRAQITAGLAAGALRPGDRLPTVRVLAADLGIAAGTIARAYRELEVAGLLTTRRRHGTVIAQRGPAHHPDVGTATLHLVAAARADNMTDQEVLDLVTGALLTHPRPGHTNHVSRTSPT
ncbi:GntR family transcriptional regulator [Cellulomonas sp. KRMCY2]|uniref:GntR family transcriptional regulator n=1 Tax=Cellulomonas sp. KRMCY2 TaxID=1304865 RepID=UPI00045EB583|nr:GntR family transcriptional regulator [Cellulomonas sp. KRMCY2]